MALTSGEYAKRGNIIPAKVHTGIPDNDRVTRAHASRADPERCCTHRLPQYGNNRVAAAAAATRMGDWVFEAEKKFSNHVGP